MGPQVRKTGRVLSFKYAFSGIAAAIKEEPNLKIHLSLALLVTVAGAAFQISELEWIIIVAMIGLVISVELTNTAIESVVNHFTSEIHPGAKLAKDISAGAVLVVAITAAVVGMIIFLPYLKTFGL